MAKWYGIIGFVNTVETEPGLWEEQVVERSYYGDLIRNTRKLETSGGVNDNINLANEVSIVADPYTKNNFYAMRYVKFMGAKWKITSVDVQYYPRLTLTIGGLYNGDSS
jgi:hypothetical protein